MATTANKMQSNAERRRANCVMQCAAPNAATSSGAGGRCLRPGPVGRNPYLNFLREFRKSNCGLSAVETIRKGAEEWRKLPPEQKLKYIAEAFYAPIRRRRRRRRRMNAAMRIEGSTRTSSRRARQRSGSRRRRRSQVKSE
ncbi:uncharacterized protein [Musca autumnalis]|uniref:uncharacterized protein n=1 Tax=Musca autumnalis TaxID=221902 RepID=UPI003CF85D14